MSDSLDRWDRLDSMHPEDYESEIGGLSEQITTLQAENARLRTELDAAKAEVAALREGLEKAKRSLEVMVQEYKGVWSEDRDALQVVTALLSNPNPGAELLRDREQAAYERGRAYQKEADARLVDDEYQRRRTRNILRECIWPGRSEG